jgi:hypothetical protein
MAFNADQFRGQLIGDGARPNLFEVSLTYPNFVTSRVGSGLVEKSRFMIKAAQLPGSTLGSVPQFYFGREVKVPGNRTFADWTVQVINDEDFRVRRAMEAWMRGINDNRRNVRDASMRTSTGGSSALNGVGLSSGGYAVDAEINQYGKVGGSLKRYKFVGMFPIDISPIELDWGSNDTIEEFSVTFQYQYWDDVGNLSGVGL